MIIKRAALGLGIISAWLGIALLSMLTGQIATAAVPRSTTLPENVAIVGATERLWIVRSDAPDYVQDLYANGALFVLPARQKTCLTLQKTPQT